MFRPLVATVALYVFSKSFHEPARSFPHVIRMIMARVLLLVVHQRGAGKSPSQLLGQPATVPRLRSLRLRGSQRELRERLLVQALRHRHVPRLTFGLS